MLEDVVYHGECNRVMGSTGSDVDTWQPDVPAEQLKLFLDVD